MSQEPRSENGRECDLGLLWAELADRSRAISEKPPPPGASRRAVQRTDQGSQDRNGRAEGALFTLIRPRGQPELRDDPTCP